ncbi:MAG: DUF411 domain-containing protein [Pseudaminobacter sp.]|jgi:hypothetical protein|uniref:Metal-binding protein n=1 Tax=Aquamicrobium defluvii TaxID=69279 RepID=A0A011TUS0_9HYPH|nr:DUF411 domain-containing protein [Aquamicrobium defluvii]EXL07887.1 metal-binding protein [Aquamicrobium defluvii]EZQ14940.1 metal-binding protein [Halopseudomonas bauzanensis]TDR34901.1 hypothetical protein DES43_112113 [Aquamicrobium defluvii]
MNTYSRSLFAAIAVLVASPVAASAAAEMTVYKTPWCGCCHAWAEAVEKAGYQVSTVDLEDLSSIRKQAGVPAEMEGCHIAAVDGYFLEGHVPLEAVKKLLSERPNVAGLAAPGMPQGSLGMGDDPSASYEVYAVPRQASEAPQVFYRAGGK